MPTEPIPGPTFESGIAEVPLIKITGLRSDSDYCALELTLLFPRLHKCEIEGIVSGASHCLIQDRYRKISHIMRISRPNRIENYPAFDAHLRQLVRRGL